MNRFSYLLCVLCLSSVHVSSYTKQPRVSLITSVYNGDPFMPRFLKNITQQTIFNECELILINAHSPGNEDPIILEYMKQYPENITYIKLYKDPGVYGVWNLGLFLAQAPYVTNANIDDLRYADCLERQADFLDNNQEISLVYGEFKCSYDPVSDIDECAIFLESNHVPVKNFKTSLSYCIPGPQPMWRKSVHAIIGLFEPAFLYSGDWEFWNRMAKAGFLFAQMEGYTGVYYFNPDGLSTNQVPEKVARRKLENSYIMQTYSAMWNGQE